SVEVRRSATLQGIDHGLIGAQYHLAVSLMRQAFGVTADLVGVEVFVVVIRMVELRRRGFFVEACHIHANLLSLIAPLVGGEGTKCRRLGGAGRKKGLDAEAGKGKGGGGCGAGASEEMAARR